MAAKTISLEDYHIMIDVSCYAWPGEVVSKDQAHQLFEVEWQRSIIPTEFIRYGICNGQWLIDYIETYASFLDRPGCSAVTWKNS